MTPFIRNTIRLVDDADLDPTQFHWFDISGDIDNGARADVDPLMTHRPPFEKNFVVWRGSTKHHSNYEMMMIVAGTDPEEGIFVTMWKGAAGGRPMQIPAMVYLLDGDVVRYGAVDENAPIEKDVAELILALVAAWYAAMDKRAKAYIPTVKDSFTNRRKIAEGKTPIYDWRTVIIEPSAPRSGPLGGTHASPRLHDRRGHLRRLRSGKSVWVRPCRVGDASKGVVFHDYEVRV